MKLTNVLKQEIIKDIKLFIPNHREFFEQFNENSIIYGRYLLHLINKDNVENNKIDILTNMNNFRFIHHFLSDNQFVITNFNSSELVELDLSGIKKYNTDIIWYEKSVGNFTLKINIIKTPNIYNYLNMNVKLLIEQNYYNGSLVVLPHKKYTKLKFEVNDRIKLNDPKLTKKISYYVKHGYSFKIITTNEKIVFKSNNYSGYRYYINLLKYHLNIE